MSVKPKQRTGTGRETGSASRPIRVRRTREKSRWSASTTATSSAAKSRTRTAPTTTYVPDFPEKPRVDIGPKAYVSYKSGARKVIRFFVDRPFVRDARNRWKPTSVWYVLDMGGERLVAAGTKKQGYPEKKDAVRVAREYRDKYGAYVKVEF